MNQNEEEIFTNAILMDNEVARERYLEEACGGNREILEQVRRLVQAHLTLDSLLDHSAESLDDGPTEMPPLHSFGEFEVIREIGRGGMGIVYEAQQRSLNRRVALKVLSLGISYSKSSLLRFQREAEAAARLHHTNIVPVYTTGTQNEIPYYAMELVNGPSLEWVIRNLRLQEPTTDHSDTLVAIYRESVTSEQTQTGLFSETSTQPSRRTDYFDSVARLVAAAADAIDYSHQNGIIHRDIKPSNLLVSAGERVRITDFGLARAVNDPSMTTTGELLGSPRYMSPEQVASTLGPLDHRTDIYSLGATLYELLTLRPAFEGEHREHILAKVIREEPTPPRRCDRSIPRDLETICLCALEKSPADRYQTAAAMAADLRLYLDRRAIKARPIGHGERMIRWYRRNRLIAALSLALVASLAFGPFLLAWSRANRVHLENRRFDAALSEIDSLRIVHPWEAILRLRALKDEYPGRMTSILSVEKKIGRPIRMESIPPGAKLAVRPLNDSTGPWLDAGSTPATVQLPMQLVHVKVTFPRSNELITRQSVHNPSRDSWIFYRSALANMIRVPASSYEPWRDMWRIPWLEHRVLPELEAFDLDHHEVTNAEYQAFVDDARYRDRQYWEPILGESWHDVLTNRFIDSSGQSGPQFWVHGRYLAGSQDHPVVGISWYEAMAYSRWSNKQLPTIYHWLRGAAYDGLYDVPDREHLSNMDRQMATTRSVSMGQLNVSTYGVIETEGNVKEWCLNEAGSGNYYAMGGSWLDDEGTMFQPIAFDPMTRNEQIGFRCAVYAPHSHLVSAAPIRWRKEPSERLSDNDLIDPYRYDTQKPFRLKDHGLVPFEDLVAHCYEMDAAYGEHERLTCYILLPDRKQFRPPYQIMLGSSPLERDEKGGIRVIANIFRHYRPLVDGGRALVLPALWGNDTTQADLPRLNTWDPQPDRMKQFEAGMVRVANDISRTVDFLHAYDDLVQPGILNAREMGYVACGQTNTTAAVVADGLLRGASRFRAIIFCEGGILHCEQPATVDPLNFLPHLKVPTMMLVTKRWLGFPFEHSQKFMYDQIPMEEGSGKQWIHIPNFSYGIPPEHMDRDVNWFLDKHLPVTEPAM